MSSLPGFFIDFMHSNIINNMYALCCTMQLIASKFTLQVWNREIEKNENPSFNKIFQNRIKISLFHFSSTRPTRPITTQTCLLGRCSSMIRIFIWKYLTLSNQNVHFMELCFMDSDKRHFVAHFQFLCIHASTDWCIISGTITFWQQPKQFLEQLMWTGLLYFSYKYFLDKIDFKNLLKFFFNLLLRINCRGSTFFCGIFDADLWT